MPTASDGRLRRRLVAVLTHSGSRLLVPLASPVVALLVIRLASVDLWGEFIRVLVVIQLVAHIAGWGNRDFLLRAFSRQPATRATAWQTAFFTRLVVAAIGCLAFVLLGYPPSQLLASVCLTFLLVANQSFDVFVVYRRAFTLATLAEVSALAITVAAVLVARDGLTVEGLITIYSVAQLFKTGALWWRFRMDVRAGRAGRIDLSWLKSALPFFLLGFTGLLQTRADLYVVSSILPPGVIGRYHVFINLIIFLQSIAGLVLMPFVKGLYRLPPHRILAPSFRLIGLGAIVVSTGVPASALVLSELYGLAFSASYFVAGAAAVMPAFAYLPIIYGLFRVGRAGQVVITNLCGVGVSLALLGWWLPQHGLLGAAWATACSQLAMLAVYGVLSWHLRKRHAVPVSDLP